MDQDSDFAPSTHIFNIKSSACKNFRAQGFKPVSSKAAVLDSKSCLKKFKTKEPAYTEWKRYSQPWDAEAGGSLQAQGQP